MEKDNEIMAIRQIVTPYNFAVRCKEYNLQQQKLLFKVSEAMQSYFQEYIDKETARGKKLISPIFSEAQKKKGIPTINVPMSELNIDPSNTAHARKSLTQFLAMTVPSTVIRENGKIDDEEIFLFNKRSIERGSTIVRIALNMEAAEIIFDMTRKGYITHPDDIALTSKKDKTPALYLHLKSKTKNWKYHKVKFSPLELKESLGMVEKDHEGTITKIEYPKFSKFKSMVIEPLLEDLDRMKKEGKVECSFDVEYDYMGRKPKGDPVYIIFSIKPDEAEEIKEPTEKKVEEPQQTEIVFEQEPQPQEQPQEQEPPKFKTIQEKAREELQTKWDSFLLHYKGRGKEYFAQMKMLGTKSEGLRGSELHVGCSAKVSKQIRDLKLAEEEWNDIYSRLRKHKIIQNKLGDIKIIPIITD